MSHAYTPVPTALTTVTLPDDNDPGSVATVNTPFEQLADALAFQGQELFWRQFDYDTIPPTTYSVALPAEIYVAASAFTLDAGSWVELALEIYAGVDADLGVLLVNFEGTVTGDHIPAVFAVVDDVTHTVVFRARADLPADEYDIRILAGVLSGSPANINVPYRISPLAEAGPFLLSVRRVPAP